jgi:hypothetical protein
MIRIAKKNMIMIAMITSVAVSLNSFCICRPTAAAEASNKNKVKSISYLYPAYMNQNDSGKLGYSSEEWGYIDDNGKFIIKPGFETAEDFQKDGLARISLNDKFGFIDKSGKYIVKPTFDYLTDFSEGLACGKDSSGTKVIDEKGKVVFKSSDDINEFKSGIAVFGRKITESETLYGYINKAGKVIIKPIYKSAENFIGGKALVQLQNDKYALINTAGKVLATINYNWVYSLSEDTLVFNDAKSGKCGYITSSGKILISARYESAMPFSNGKAVVAVTDKSNQMKYGIINKKGSYIVKPQYGSIDSLNNGLFAVTKWSSDYIPSPAAKKALMDANGKLLTSFNYYSMEALSDGNICVSDENSTFLIGRNGIKLKGYPEVKGDGSLEAEGNIIKANVDNKLMYLTKSGKVIWQPDGLFKLQNGAAVKEVKYRPDRSLLVYYPQLTGLADSKVQSSINDKLKTSFIGDGNYVPEKEDGYYMYDNTYDYEALQNKNLLIIMKDGYVYPLGAAHGQPIKEYFKIDVTTGQFYTLQNLFKKDSKFMDRINSIIKKQIDDKSKDSNYMIFDGSFTGIRADQGFTVTKDGLEIYFDPYEIAPYAAGFPAFDIPYSELSDILDTQGAFFQSFDKNMKN